MILSRVSLSLEDFDHSKFHAPVPTSSSPYETQRLCPPSATPVGPVKPGRLPRATAVAAAPPGRHTLRVTAVSVGPTPAAGATQSVDDIRGFPKFWVERTGDAPFCDPISMLVALDRELDGRTTAHWGRCVLDALSSNDITTVNMREPTISTNREWYVKVPGKTWVSDGLLQLPNAAHCLHNDTERNDTEWPMLAVPVGDNAWLHVAAMYEPDLTCGCFRSLFKAIKRCFSSSDAKKVDPPVRSEQSSTGSTAKNPVAKSAGKASTRVGRAPGRKNPRLRRRLRQHVTLITSEVERAPTSA